MRGPEGGFYSALDADSEGVEGRFYVWTRGRAARRAAATTGCDDEAIAYFGATAEGNFEHGANVLEAPRPAPCPSAWPRSAGSCSRCARRGSGRGSTTSG